MLVALRIFEHGGLIQGQPQGLYSQEMFTGEIKEGSTKLRTTQTCLEILIELYQRSESQKHETRICCCLKKPNTVPNLNWPHVTISYQHHIEVACWESQTLAAVSCTYGCYCIIRNC